MDELNWLPPELIDALSKAGLLPARMGEANKLYQHGVQHEDYPMPQGRTPQDGYQAANPMEIWDAVLKRQQGEGEISRSQQTIANMLRQYQKTSKDYLDAWQKSQAQGRQDAGPGFVPPPVKSPYT